MLTLIYLLVSTSYLYQIAHLGDDDEEPEFSSAMPLEEGDTFFFQPRPLKNLVLVDEQENLSPIMSCQVRVCVFVCTLPVSTSFKKLRCSYFVLFSTDCRFGQRGYTTAVRRLWTRTPVYSEGP